MTDPRPWAKIDAAYFHNPKWFKIERILHSSMPNIMANSMANDMASAIANAMRVAREAHLASILYSAQHQTDGLFPVRAIKATCMITNDLEEAAITALFEVGMWINHTGGMAEVRDYLEHQTPASLVKKRSEAGKKGAAARWGKSSIDSKSHRDANGKTMAHANAEEKRREENIYRGAKPKKATQLPKTWQPTQDHVARAAALGLNLKREQEKFMAHAEEKGRTAKSWNAAFTRWLINAAEYSAQNGTPQLTVEQANHQNLVAAWRERYGHPPVPQNLYDIPAVANAWAKAFFEAIGQGYSDAEAASYANSQIGKKE